MRTISLMSFLFFNVHLLLSQIHNGQEVESSKPVLSIHDFNSWPSVEDGMLSNDGKYVWFSQRGEDCNHLIVRSISGHWQRSILYSLNAHFTDDSKRIVSAKDGDTLCIMTLGHEIEKCITNVTEFKLIQKNSEEVLIYKLNASQKNALVIEKLGCGINWHFENVSQYAISPNNDRLVLTIRDKRCQQDSLYVVDILNQRHYLLSAGTKINNIVFSLDGTQIAFSFPTNSENQIMICPLGEAQSGIIKKLSPEVDGQFKLDQIIRYDKSGNRLLIRMKNVISADIDRGNMASVDLWNYTD